MTFGKQDFSVLGSDKVILYAAISVYPSVSLFVQRSVRHQLASRPTRSCQFYLNYPGLRNQIVLLVSWISYYYYYYYYYQHHYYYYYSYYYYYYYSRSHGYRSSGIRRQVQKRRNNAKYYPNADPRADDQRRDQSCGNQTIASAARIW